MADADPLSGKRVLVVEDEVIVAMQLEDLLLGFGCEVIGPASHLDQAHGLAETDALDAAVLDVNINGRSIRSVAERLAERGVPIVLATGYGQAGCVDLPKGPVLQKPYRSRELASALRQAMAAGTAA